MHCKDSIRDQNKTPNLPSIRSNCRNKQTFDKIFNHLRRWHCITIAFYCIIDFICRVQTINIIQPMSRSNLSDVSKTTETLLSL